MTERARFVALHAEGLHSVADLAARFGVSRKTAYKWLARYAAGGLERLAASTRWRTSPRSGTPSTPRPTRRSKRSSSWPARSTRRGGRASSSRGSPSGTPTWCSPQPRPPAPSSSATGSSSLDGGVWPPIRGAVRSSPTPRATCGRPTARGSARSGPVQDRRRRLLLPADRLRRPLTLRPRLRGARLGRAGRRAPRLRPALPPPATAGRGARAAPLDPHRQRGPVRHPGHLRALAAVGAVGTDRAPGLQNRPGALFTRLPLPRSRCPSVPPTP